MSPKELEAQRKHQQEEAQRKTQDVELTEMARKDEEKRRYALAPAAAQANVNKEESHHQNENQDHSPMMDAYRKKFNKEPATDKQGRPVLSFNSPEEASAFFKDMAKQGHQFLAVEVDQNGKFNGNIMLSLGDGELIEGKINPPEKTQDFMNKYSEYMNEKDPQKRETLKADLMDMLKPEPTKQFRSKIQEQRGAEAAYEMDEVKQTTDTKPGM